METSLQKFVTCILSSKKHCKIVTERLYMSIRKTVEMLINTLKPMDLRTSCTLHKAVTKNRHRTKRKGKFLCRTFRFSLTLIKDNKESLLEMQVYELSQEKDTRRTFKYFNFILFFATTITILHVYIHRSSLLVYSDMIYSSAY